MIREGVSLVNPQCVGEPFEHRLESPVRFSLSQCSLDKKYCISKLGREYLKRLYKTLGHFEHMTWKQFQQLPRESGITFEKEGLPVFEFLKNSYPYLNNFGHIRVDGVDTPFRVVLAKGDGVFYLLLFDRDGCLHH